MLSIRSFRKQITARICKYKQLIEVATSAQIPCRYCSYFHDKAARLNGANDAEIKEAIALAAEARHWSTFLNGAGISEKKFRSDVKKVVKIARKKMAKKN